MEAKQDNSNIIQNTFEILVIDKSNSIKDKIIDEKSNKMFYEDKCLFYKEKTVSIKSSNYHLKIYSISDKKSLKCSILPNLKTFKMNIFVYDTNELKSFENIKSYINELESENNEVEKILIGNNKDIKKEKKIPKECVEILAKNFKMKFFEITTDKSELFNELCNNNNFVDKIINIKHNEEKNNNFNEGTGIEALENQYSNMYKNILEYMIKNSDDSLFNKIKNKQDEINDKYSFFFSNDFAIKIFDLFDKLLIYSPQNLESINGFMEFIKSENEKLKDIISDFPLITYKNRNAYFASYYFYALNKLLNYFLYYQKRDNNSNDEYKKIEDEEDKKEEEIENEEKENEREEKKYEERLGKEEKEYEDEENEKINIRIELEEKKRTLEKNFETIFAKYKNVLFKNTTIQNDYQILSNFSLKIEAFQTIFFELKNIQETYIKVKDILDNYNSYFTDFFQEYLRILSKLLNSIPMTLNYFKKKIKFDENLNNEKLKETLEEFDYFIFYIFNYDYINNIDKLSQIIELFEGFFQNKNPNLSLIKDGYKFQMKKDFTLIQTNPINKKIILENCDKYCINLIMNEKLKKNRYLNEKFFYILNFPKYNAFEKYKAVYKNFFIEIFQTKCIKELFIFIFPYLDEHYSTINGLLNDVFTKIRTFNFRPIEDLEETFSPMISVYIKNFFEGNDNIESEICVSAAFIILIFHELVHYIRIYIYKITGDTKYRKSIDICSEEDVGILLEKLLFGDEILSINSYQAIFLLNKVKYNFSYSEFRENFQNLRKKNNNKDYKKDLDECGEFLKSIGLTVKKLDEKNMSSNFNIKSNKNIFFLGINNDKRGREVNYEEIFKGTGFEYLLKRNLNKSKK